MEAVYKIEAQWGRAFLHASIGLIALVCGQILPFSVSDKVEVALVVGVTLSVLDLGVRLPLYYWLVHGQGWRPRPSRFRTTFLMLEDRLLLRTNILREQERGMPATAVHFTLGVLGPLVIGIPIWAVVPAVVMFGFGDPTARLAGIKFGGRKVWADGTKTWAGALGYFYAASFAGLVTIILQAEFPLYPPSVPITRLVGAVLITAALSSYFESMCEKGNSLFSKIIDDNFLVPCAGSVAFYAAVSAGT